MRNLLHAALLSAALGLVLACGSSRPAPEWVERDVATSNESLLVQTIQFALDEQRYRVGGGLDTGNRRIETNWKEVREPFGGKRSRAVVEWEKQEATSFQVRVRVEVETNESERPLDPAYDDWRPLPDAPNLATAVVVALKLRMGDYGIEINDVESPFTEIPDRR